MKKVLKTAAEAPLKAHQFLALPLSIIFCESGYENWFYNEFTQLLAHHNDSRELTVIYYNYTYLEEYEPLDCLRLTDKMLEIKEHIVDFFKIMLRHDYYVYEFCDDFYISALNIKHHRYHDILIYGYNDDKNVFYGKAYVGVQIRDIVIPYEQLIKAHNSEYIQALATKSIFFYRRRNVRIELNPEKLKWHLLDYMEGVDSLSREAPRAQPNKNACWGVRVYDAVERSLLKNPSELTRNNMYCLCEHKHNMRDKLNYFSKNTGLVLSDKTDERLAAVCGMAERFFKLAMKLNYKLSADMYVQREQTTLLEQLHALKKAESEALQAYYDENKSVFESM